MQTMDGQHVHEKEIDAIARQIRKLTAFVLDELLDAIQFRVFKHREAEHAGEPPFRAATHALVKSVQRNFRSARAIAVELVFESDLQLLREKLRSLIQDRHSQPPARP